MVIFSIHFSISLNFKVPANTGMYVPSARRSSRFGAASTVIVIWSFRYRYRYYFYFLRSFVECLNRNRFENRFSADRPVGPTRRRYYGYTGFWITAVARVLTNIPIGIVTLFANGVLCRFVRDNRFCARKE